MVANQLKIKKYFMKIKFYPDDDDLLLGEILDIPVLIIVIKSVFRNENKYYPQVDIHEDEYEIYIV